MAGSESALAVGHGRSEPTLGDVFRELLEEGETRKPVLVQEAYANDFTELSEIVRWIGRLNVRAVMQWPLDRTAPPNT